MGYIPATACNYTVNVYLTDLGREYLIKGDTSKSTVKYFTLGDSDTNYLVAKTDNAEGYRNIPEIDFIPALGGDVEGCLKVTKAVEIKSRISVTGSTDTDNIIFYNTTAKIKTCAAIINNPIDCSSYADEIALESEVLVDTIWECLVENFNGTL